MLHQEVNCISYTTSVAHARKLCLDYSLGLRSSQTVRWDALNTLASLPDFTFYDLNQITTCHNIVSWSCDSKRAIFVFGKLGLGFSGAGETPSAKQSLIGKKYFVLRLDCKQNTDVSDGTLWGKESESRWCMLKCSLSFSLRITVWEDQQFQLPLTYLLWQDTSQQMLPTQSTQQSLVRPKKNLTAMAYKSSIFKNTIHVVVFCSAFQSFTLLQSGFMSSS